MSKEIKRKGNAAKACVAGTLVLGLSVACIPNAIAYSTENSEAVMLIAEQAAAPAEYDKTEVVYATLSATGAARGVYVVNQFDVSAAGTIEDFGTYSTVANLTDQTALKYADGATSFEVAEGAFYYQGNTAVDAAKLPWNVTISYTLDGAAISPEDVAGKSGELGIHLTTSRADGVDAAFADSYMLQVTFTLNGDTATDIEAEGATVASAGRERTIAFTALPGKDADCTLTAKVNDFEMAGVQIAALPYSMVMEMPDTSDMESQMQELSDAISEMDAGIADLAAGSAVFSEGLGLTAQGAQGIADGSDLISQNLNTLAYGISSGNTEIEYQLRNMADNINALAEGVAKCQVAVGEYQALVATLWSEYGNAADAAGRLSTSQNSDDVEALLGFYEAVGRSLPSSATSSAATGSEATSGEQQSADLAASLRDIADGLNAVADAMSVANPDDPNFANAVAGLQDLAKSYADLNIQIGAFADGVADLNTNYAILNEGTQQFAGGISQLNQATIKIPATMRAEIESMMEEYDFPEFDPISFVDDRNDEHMVAVQFVLTTDAISVEEPEAEVEEEEAEQTVVDRFFALFE